MTRMGTSILFAFIGTMVFFLFLRRVSLRSTKRFCVSSCMTSPDMDMAAPASTRAIVRGRRVMGEHPTIRAHRSPARLEAVAGDRSGRRAAGPVPVAQPRPFGRAGGRGLHEAVLRQQLHDQPGHGHGRPGQHEGVFPSATLMTRMGTSILFAFIGTMVFFLFLRRVSPSAAA
jgi:hypothetical protein